MGDKFRKTTDERDAGAFRSLVATFWPKVVAMLMRGGADRETAEGIAQETLLALWDTSHPSSGDKGSAAASIFAIARNLRIDRMKRRPVWQRYSDEVEGLAQAHPVAEAGRAPEEQRAEIEQALTRLAPEQLQVMHLSFIDGLSQSEIAARLGVPLGTVKLRMLCAYQELRGAMEQGS